MLRASTKHTVTLTPDQPLTSANTSRPQHCPQPKSMLRLCGLTRTGGPGGTTRHVETHVPSRRRQSPEGRVLTTASEHFHYHHPADDRAAQVVLNRLARNDQIDVTFDPDLQGPYLVSPHGRTIVLPEGIPWHTAHARLNRCWLYLVGGTDLAPEFAPVEREDPNSRFIPRIGNVVVPFLRRAW